MSTIDIDDAADAVVKLVKHLHENGIAMHQYDNEKLYGLLKEIFRDIRKER